MQLGIFKEETSVNSGVSKLAIGVSLYSPCDIPSLLGLPLLSPCDSWRGLQTIMFKWFCLTLDQTIAHMNKKAGLQLMYFLLRWLYMVIVLSVCIAHNLHL